MSKTERVTVYIDGQAVSLPKGKNLLEALLECGVNLPYFCWHPEMGSIGACRQCAVVQYRDEDDNKGRIVMSCMTPVTEGAMLSVNAGNATEFRKSVVETLMINHPHDCPVCEEGGECHLQDMTVMTGHRDRRHRGTKVTFRNQYLGPLISHEMNRCITCYRCVRFYQDYAGGHDLGAFASRDRVYFSRAEDGVLENEFAGNLVEVCPTGVFTDKPLSLRYTRKWDLQSAPAVCTGCSLGCNISTSERYGELRRIHNRYNHRINGYFLCDRGRFGGDFVNHESRLRQCGIRNDEGKYDAVDTEDAVDYAANLIGASARVIGIGSPRASIEANHALYRLVGKENFFAGTGRAEGEIHRLLVDILKDTPA
ncbi:MAG: (2Fe-2S)-binding protein, partial [Pseudomonadales bacterium]|nr:(2Fe-2S)-binding protein [Pseudomonadales bacterium]